MKPRTQRKPKTKGVLDKIKNFFQKPANNTKKAFQSIKKQSYKQLKKMKH